jgi:6-hydroxycyclohex-1-ene-1-carbonyl-CoA dehydrogenase
VNSAAFRWVMTAAGAPLQKVAASLAAPGAGEALVRVLGCGVCHTDLGFLHGGVRTHHALPLTLGHEIAGVVETCGAGAEAWRNRTVVVPAVLPCGQCALCAAGRETSCRAQSMPGNDFHGGFASHVTVPARWLVDVGELPAGLEPADVAVLADAITTPYQALVRARATAGDAVVIIGAGGIGSFGVQIARAWGASVVAIDVDDARLERARRFGASGAVNVRGLDAKAARVAAQDACRAAGQPATGLKVLEMSGTAAGQELAWSLLTPAGVLGIVGFCLDRVPVRLSNLMAFDADAFGNWGCRPQLYAPALELVRSGQVQVKPFIHRFPMESVNEVLTGVRSHRITERPVLIP